MDGPLPHQQNLWYCQVQSPDSNCCLYYMITSDTSSLAHFFANKNHINLDSGTNTITDISYHGHLPSGDTYHPGHLPSRALTRWTLTWRTLTIPDTYHPGLLPSRILTITDTYHQGTLTTPDKLSFLGRVKKLATALCV